MPAGFRIASAWVDIHAEDGGLRREIQSAVRSAVAGVEGNIDLNVQASKLRSRVEAAVRSATSGVSGNVDLDLDSKGLRSKIESAIKSATTGARGEVKLDLDAGSLRAKVAAALKTATTGQDGKVKLDIDDNGLRAKVSAAVKSATTGQDNRIRLDLDADDFNARLARVLANMRNQTVRVKTDVDPVGLRVGLAAATRAAAAGAKVKVGLDLDSNALSAKVRSAVAVASRERIRTNIDVDAAGLRAKVSAAVLAAGAGQRIHVKVDVDRNNWASAQAMMRSFTQAGEAGLNGIMSQLRFIPGLGRIAAGGISVIGPALVAVAAVAMIAFNAIVLLGGALAALALPVGIIALGGFLQKAQLQVTAFTTSLKGIGTAVTSSLGPAINGAMSQIVGSLSQMRGALTAMFSNAAALVQPLTTALMNLVSNMIPGVTAALGNMQAAMPGIQAGFAQMGQGIGNFFKEIASNGEAVGKVWATIGTGINRVLTSVGQAFAKLAGNDAAIALLGATFEALAVTIDTVASATAAFAPMLLQLVNNFNMLMSVAGPVLDVLGRVSSATSSFFSGNIGGAFSQLFGDGASKAKEFGTAVAAIPGPLSSIGAASTATAGAVRQQADAFAKAAEAAKKLDSAAGPGASAIKAQLDGAKASADALAESMGRLGDLARTALGGQTSFAQAVLDAKSSAKDLAGSLKMSNGELQLTSQKSIDAAKGLQEVATSGMDLANTFMEQGNFAQAAAQVDKTRAAITSLGQSFGLPKAEAEALATKLTTTFAKEHSFKLNMEQARAGLDSVTQAFSQLTGKEQKVTVTAMTDSAKAALTALGFQVKDLGNGKFEVKANTDTARASLTGLQTVLDGLANKKASVQVEAGQVPQVTAALEALGMKVTSLPNGDIKVTAQDGASTVIQKVKSGMDGIPPTKTTAWNMFGDAAAKASETKTVLDDVPTSKTTSWSMAGDAAAKARETKTVLDDIPNSKSTAINVSGNAATAASGIRAQIDALKPKQIPLTVSGNAEQRAKSTKTVLDDIPASKNSALNATGNAQQKAQEAKAAIEGMPTEKKIAVLIEVSQNATSALTTLKQTLDGMNNTNISISINILGKDGIATVSADLQNMKNKTVTVTISVSKGGLDAAKTAIDGLKNKDVKINVTANVGSAQSAINGLKAKDLRVKVTADVGSAQSAINGLKAKDVQVKVTADTGGAQGKISAIKGKTVNIKVVDSPSASSVQGKISAIKGKTVTIRVVASGIGAVQGAINSIRGKTVTVTVVTKKVGSAAGGGHMTRASLAGYASGGNVMRNYKPGGDVVGPGTATSDDILAKLSNGEFVIRAAMVRKFGHGFFAALNAGVVPYSNMANAVRGFSSGGSVGSSGTTNYTVQRGDTLTALAKKFNTTVDELVRLNRIANRNLILIGQTLKMPSKTAGKTPWGQTPLSSMPGNVAMPGYGNIPIAPDTAHLFGWAELPKGNFTGGPGGKPNQSQIEGRRDLINLSSMGPYAQMAGGKNSQLYHELSNPSDMKALIETLYKARQAAQKADLKTPIRNKLLAQLDAGAAVLMRNQAQLEAVNASLATATEKLTELKGQFDQLKNAVRDNVLEYGKITKIGKYGTSVNTLTDQLQRDVNKSASFKTMLDQLKNNGLSDDMIKQIGEAGIEGGGFATAQSLINASPEEIQRLNGLNEQLIANANAAGVTVAATMYQSGIDAAQGLVDGLKAQQSQIETVMKQIAKSMEVAIKQALGIASPSKVMHKLGEWTGMGLVTGMDAKVKDVLNAARNLVSLPGSVAGLPSLPGMGGSTSGGASTGTISGGSGGFSIGELHVHIDGTFDLTNPAQRRKIAQELVAEIKEEIRLSDKARAR